MCSSVVTIQNLLDLATRAIGVDIVFATNGLPPTNHIDSESIVHLKNFGTSQFTYPIQIKEKTNKRDVLVVDAGYLLFS